MEMSAIDYAIYYKYPEAALAMVTHEERAEEIMVLKSDKHPCVTLALIASMPRVFEAVQDKCITKANCKKDSKSFYVSIFDDAITINSDGIIIIIGNSIFQAQNFVNDFFFLPPIDSYGL